MEAKCFLSRAYKLHREIQIKKEQLASIRESLSNITKPIDKEHVSHTPDSSPMENALISFHMMIKMNIYVKIRKNIFVI